MKRSKLLLTTGALLVTLGLATACQNKADNSKKEDQPKVTKVKHHKKSKSHKKQKSTNQEISNSSVNVSNSETKQKSESAKVAGDQGLFNVPANMQGTWYSSEGSITFGPHSVTTNGQEFQFHIQEPGYIDNHPMGSWNQDYENKVKNWYRTSWMEGPHGVRYLNGMGWGQGAGDGDFWAAHTEAGQPVIVAASGAGLWTDTVYWKSPALAKQHANEKFNDLSYRPGEGPDDNNDED